MATPGKPAWVETSSPDMAAGKDFYGGLFGWSFETDPNPDFGGYTIALSDGEPVAGLYPPMPDQDIPPAWLLYLYTADVNETAKQLTDLGGQVVMGPMEIPGKGSMLLGSDPTGAMVGFWVPGGQPPMATGRPGTLGWTELLTRDPQGADRFYGALFGYEEDQIGDGERFDYKVLSLGGEQVVGRMRIGDEFPADMPPNWAIYFWVPEEQGVDGIADKARSSGGTIVTEPFDSPYGRIAVVRDPFGATFSLVDPSRVVPDAGPSTP